MENKKTMSISKNKIIPKFLTTILLGIFVSLFLINAQVTFADFWDDLGDKIIGGDSELSFKQYEGGLTELSDEGYDSGLTSSGDLKEFILRVVNFALGFLGIFAVIIIIYGGILYVTAAGEEERATKGKKAIGYAVIGLLIVMGSFALVNTVIRGALIGEEGINGSQNIGSKDGDSEGKNSAGNFQAAANEIQTLAKQIYDGYIFLAEMVTTFKKIQNDAEKPSLEDPPKKDMIEFLSSIESKYQKAQKGLGKFSKSYVEIENQLRSIDTFKDQIETIDGDFLQEAWDSTFKGPLKYGECENNELCLDRILEYASGEYASNVVDKLKKVAEIHDDIIEIIAQSEAEEFYGKMLTEYGCETTNTPDSTISCEEQTGFLPGIKSSFTTLSDAVDYTDIATGSLKNALENQLRFAQAIKDIQTVKVNLRANVTSGKAPLTVRLDVLETYDPAGGNLQEENIEWDTDVFGENSKCEYEDPTGSAKKVFGGKVFVVCNIYQPGLYEPKVTITSNDPTKYAFGSDTIKIKVLPPSTRINLKVNNEYVFQYEDNLGDSYNLKIYRDSLTVALQDTNYNSTCNIDSSKGLAFDASSTNQASLGVEKYSLDFGDGQKSENSSGAFCHIYNELGDYNVKLQVKNKVGDVDKVEFSLKVREIAAVIKISPEEDIFIGDEVNFDASHSKSLKGKITYYEWTINQVGSGTKLVLGDKANKKSFKYKFDKPGEYEVGLKIRDASGTEDTSVPKTFHVKSNPPVANFDAISTSDSQPNLLQLKNKSYDPDEVTEKSDLTYQWQVEGIDIEGDNNWSFMQNTNDKSENPLIKFNKKGEYKITLIATDPTINPPEVSQELSKNVSIKDTLFVEWEPQDITKQLGDDGTATIEFNFSAENAVAYELDFGDDQNKTADIPAANQANLKNEKVPHLYTKPGEYAVKLTVFDEDDNGKSIKKKIIIGPANLPTAVIVIKVNGVEFQDLTVPINVYRNDVITFDASKSLNTDGTGRELKYSWDIHAGIQNNNSAEFKSSDEKFTHKYKELGDYKVKLTVTDENNLQKKDTLDGPTIKVINEDPTFLGFQAIPQKGELITPLNVELKLYGAEDPDGEIVQYKWWYYPATDLDDKNNPLGVQITKKPSAVLTVGTNGVENQEMGYKFAVEIVDQDNTKVASKDILDINQIPEISVKNGPNKLPDAKFSVNKTKVLVGEKIKFTSASKDPDGKIIEYKWDPEGDGFFDNAAQTQPSFEYSYERINLNGYQVKLQVTDDRGGVAVSEAVKIYVDTNAVEPTAAFTSKSKSGSDGKIIQFTNNSKADEDNHAEIEKYIWDFDTNFDSDGDGENDNDSDSTDKNPIHGYAKSGNYNVKLTVIDNFDKQDKVINKVKIVDPVDPTASSNSQNQSSALKAVLKTTPDANSSGIIYLNGESGNVKFDFSDSQGNISYYVFDKNIYFDSNNNFVKDDDQDFKTSLPGSWKTEFFKNWGKTTVELKVVDIYGNTKSIFREIKFL